MHIKQLIILIALVLHSYCARAQSYNFINYGIGEGLAHERITDIVEDQFGHLWLATAGGGLSRFDGLNFVNYTIKDGLPSNYIRDILADKSGNIWAATAEGISMFDGQVFVNYEIDSGSNNSINTIYEGVEGGIWFSASNGRLGHVKDARIMYRQVPDMMPTDRILDMTQDKNGAIWFVSAVKGLCNFDGNKFTSVMSNSAYRGFMLAIEYVNGQILIGTNKGVYSFQNNTLKVIPDLSKSFVKTMRLGSNDNLLVVTSTDVLNYKEGEVKTYGKDQGLSESRINTVYQDRESNLWVGSDGNGLYKLTNEIIQFLGANHGLVNLPVSAITKDVKGNMWFGSQGRGLSKLSPDGNWKYYTTEDGLPSNYITALAADGDDIIIGTRGNGIAIYDGQSFRYITTDQGLAFDIVRQIFVDRHHRIWVGTLNGLSVINEAGLSTYTIEDGLSDRLIWGINEYDDHVFVTTRRGVNIIDDLGNMGKLAIPDSLFDRRVNAFLKDDDDNYILGYSGHGILCVNQHSAKTYSTDDGLSSNLIYSLTFTDYGELVIGTERGIDLLKMQNGKVKAIKSYGQIEGYKDLQTTYEATYFDGEKIWFGMNQGVYIFNPNRINTRDIHPLVYISGLKLYHEDVSWSDRGETISPWSNLPKDLELDYANNNLVFQYGATSLSNPAAVKYQYRLMGLDDAWSSVTNRREAVFTNLSPGSYTFEVRAANSDNRWSSVTEHYTFSIVPPFYMRWWFYLLAVVVVFIIIKFIYDYRVQARLDKILTVEKIRGEEQNKVRKKMARDFHDNLGNQLASISVYTNLMQLKLKGKSKEVDDLITQIQKHTNGLFSGTKDFIWSMDPDSDDLNEICTYIRDFGEDLFNKTDIDFYAHLDQPHKSYPLPSGWSRQLVLIFKEAMTNALKHSRGSRVDFYMEVNGKAFAMGLKDDGMGLENNDKPGHNGMRNMSNRAAQIGSDFSITSSGEGTHVKVTARLPKADVTNLNIRS